MGTKTVRDNYFYELLSERLSVDDGLEESALDRGERLESEAVEAFEKATGKITEQVGFLTSDDTDQVGLSPDRLIDNNGKYTEAVEVKCLSSANHVKAWVDNEIPKDYYPQVVQYFIVNNDLEKLYFVLYDPRVTTHPLHIIEVDREKIAEDIADYKAQEMEFLQTVNDKISEIIKI